MSQATAICRLCRKLLPLSSFAMGRKTFSRTCMSCIGQVKCIHGRYKSCCMICKPELGCKHGGHRRQCMSCTPSLSCIHGRRKRRCPDCNYVKAPPSGFKKCPACGFQRPPDDFRPRGDQPGRFCQKCMQAREIVQVPLKVQEAAEPMETAAVVEPQTTNQELRRSARLQRKTTSVVVDGFSDEKIV